MVKDIETKEEKKVYPHDEVEIVYTEKSSFHKAGEKSKVHKMQAEKLVAKGVAKLAKKE